MYFNARFVATLPAADLARARAWYADKLGLNPSTEFPGGLNYTTPGGDFTLYETTFAGTAQNTAATWLAEDFEAAVADLRARGVGFEEYDMPGLKTDNGVATDTDGFKAAWFKDSEGNIHGVIQSRPGM